MRPLVWFRSDLRVADHPALAHASRAATRGVVAVFVACSAQWRDHDWGDVKVDYLRRNLEALGRRLDKLRIPLLVVRTPRFKGVAGKLLELAHRHGCDALFFNRELEWNERRRDDEVVRRFTGDGLEVRTFHDQTVIEPAAIRTATGDVFSVFTPFRRRWMKELDALGGPEVLPVPRPQPSLVCSPDDVPERFAPFHPTPRRAELWPAGEDAVHERLERFLDEGAACYPGERDAPALEATSLLSPALALGVVSARQALAAALARNRGRIEGGEAGLAAWMRQLVWREFYRHVLVGFPRVSMGRAFKPATDELAWRHDEAGFAAWTEGLTGVPIVDAGMRQLATTGYMHNRLRMVTSMFLTKDLLVDWRRGERHFMRHLVDADLANNNGGWQWSASTGTDAVPYFRIMNPWTQGRRFDPDGRFVHQHVPELREVPAAALHDPRSLARAVDALGVAYPRPIVDHGAARRRALELFKKAA